MTASLHVTQRPLGEATATLVDNCDTAYEMMRWLSTKTKIGFDTETTGLSVENDHVRLVQIGDDMRGWAIPFERWAGVVDDLVRRYEGTYVMHNAPFDVAMIRKGGVIIPTRKVHDTRLKAHVLWSTGSLALKNLAKKHVDPRAGAAQEQLDNAIGTHGGWTWATVPIDFQPYWMYGALDPVLTYRLDEVLDPLVQAEAPLAYDLELAVTWVCERMARHGAAVDRPRTQQFMDELTSYVQQVDIWCREVFDIKPGTTADVVRVLQSAGVTFTKLTDGGNISIDKDVLSNIAHPLAGAVLGRRQAQKIVSTYLMHYIDMSLSDGRIHPSINTVGGSAKNPFESGGSKGVRTGRMSMNDPNLQNVPIRTKEGKKIRNCFVPACSSMCGCGEEHTWIKCDADQIEMRLFAHLAQDQNMIDAFKLPQDFFVTMTRTIFADDTIQKDDLRRQHVKNSAYAKLYGAGTEQFAKTAGIRDSSGQLDLPVASAFLQRFDDVNPGIRRYQREVERIARMRLETEGVAYVRSPLTNRKHTADAAREYALVNYVVQGTAGEILKMKMIQADQAGLGDFMTIPVHDEVDLDVPTRMISDVSATLRDVMNDDALLSVPVTWSIETGPRWGECK